MAEFIGVLRTLHEFGPSELDDDELEDYGPSPSRAVRLHVLSFRK
jgi:hypothetical protein